MKSLEQFRHIETVKLSYLRNRGNVIEVANDTGLPLAYVTKLVHKIKKRESRDVAVHISHNLMQHVLLGHQSRVAYLMEMLKSLDNRSQLWVSVCCGVPVRVVPSSDGDYNACLRCGKPAEVRLMDRQHVYEMKQKILEQLRAEDECLVSFADKMGYTNKPEPEGPEVLVKNRQNIIVLGGELGEDGKRMVQDVAKMNAFDRHKLAKDLERRVVEGEAVEPTSSVSKDKAVAGDKVSDGVQGQETS